jgi:hypothetical protein
VDIEKLLQESEENTGEEAIEDALAFSDDL